MSAGNGDSKNGANGSGLDAVLKPRGEWLAERKAENKDGNFSQMHYARQALITDEMQYIAHREKLTPELVRDEVARATAPDYRFCGAVFCSNIRFRGQAAFGISDQRPWAEPHICNRDG